MIVSIGRMEYVTVKVLLVMNLNVLDQVLV